MTIQRLACKVFFLIAAALGLLAAHDSPRGAADAGEARTPALQQLIEAAKAEGGRFIADASSMMLAAGKKRKSPWRNYLVSRSLEALDLMNQNQFASRLLKSFRPVGSRQRTCSMEHSPPYRG